MSAKIGDVYNFVYPKEPQFNTKLKVVRVLGNGPDDLVFFDDRTHSKQKNLGGVGRVRLTGFGVIEKEQGA